MIDLEKLREVMIDLRDKDYNHGASPTEVLELIDHIAQLEKDAGRWRAVAHTVDLNDFAVVEYDNFGDSRIITGDEADSLIDTAMEEKHG